MQKSTAKAVQQELRRYANAAKAKAVSRYFKTGRGEYGQGDVFIGVTVPNQRLVVRKYQHLPLLEVDRLLRSSVHEHRMTALLLLDRLFSQASIADQKRMYQLVLHRTKYINNWDLVDTVAPAVIGMYLLNHPRGILLKLAKSKNLWERRIAIIATQTFIRHDQYTDTLKIAELLLNDKQDLIHKAVGWMLREVGNRDRAVEERFLKRCAKKMPRTMLRYAIEKFPAKTRQRYLRMS